MADPKYKKGVVNLNDEQAEIIGKVVAEFKQRNGITLSRSDAIAMVAFWYLKQQQAEKEKGND